MPGMRLLDQESRRFLGISANDFLAAWRAGAYEGRSETPEIMRLVELLPFVVAGSDLG